jgi:hypothetical protein
MGKQYATGFKESILARILPPNNFYPGDFDGNRGSCRYSLYLKDEIPITLPGNRRSEGRRKVFPDIGREAFCNS